MTFFNLTWPCFQRLYIHPKLLRYIVFYVFLYTVYSYTFILYNIIPPYTQYFQMYCFYQITTFEIPQLVFIMVKEKPLYTYRAETFICCKLFTDHVILCCMVQWICKYKLDTLAYITFIRIHLVAFYGTLQRSNIHQ